MRLAKSNSFIWKISFSNARYGDSSFFPPFMYEREKKEESWRSIRIGCRCGLIFRRFKRGRVNSKWHSFESINKIHTQKWTNKTPHLPGFFSWRPVDLTARRWIHETKTTWSKRESRILSCVRECCICFWKIRVNEDQFEEHPRGTASLKESEVIKMNEKTESIRTEQIIKGWEASLNERVRSD